MYKLAPVVREKWSLVRSELRQSADSGQAAGVDVQINEVLSNFSVGA